MNSSSRIVLRLILVVMVLSFCSQLSSAGQPKFRRSRLTGMGTQVSPKKINNENKDSSDDWLGINADFSYRVTAGQPFKIVVWLDESKQPSDAVPKTVYMEQSDIIEYKPQVFKVKPGERKTVIAKVVKSPSGLAEIDIWSDGYDEFTDYVNTGFSAKLQAQADETIFDRGSSYAVTLNLVNQQNEAVTLDGPVSLAVRASNADLSMDGRKWSSDVLLELGSGASSTKLLRVKPISIIGHPITLSTEMRLKTLSTGDEADVVLGNQHLTFSVQPAWWFLLGMAALGGLLPVIYRALRALADGNSKPVVWSRLSGQILLGAFSGMAAYALAGLDILGIRLDTSPPRTFFILGFLFAYIGLDVLLQKFVDAKTNLTQKQGTTDTVAAPSSGQ